MVFYELLMIYRPLSRAQLVNPIKRTCHEIIKRGGLLASFENLGEMKLPYLMRRERETFNIGRIQDLTTYIQMDNDVIRRRICKKEVEIYRPCDKETCDFQEMSESIRQKIANYEKTCLSFKEY